MPAAISEYTPQFVRDEGSAVAERGRALVREGAVAAIEVEQGTLSANVAGYAAAITARPVPPAIWASRNKACKLKRERTSPRREFALLKAAQRTFSRDTRGAVK